MTLSNLGLSVRFGYAVSSAQDFARTPPGENYIFPRFQKEFWTYLSCIVAVMSSTIAIANSIALPVVAASRQTFPPVADGSALFFVYEGCVTTMCSPYDETDPNYESIMAYYRSVCFQAVYIGNTVGADPGLLDV